MPQKRNLNINPYYDDFDKSNNFYKVLFKPGFPVQTRELNTLQSILQNQIEDFGSHIFQEGTVVIPGNITYDDKYYAIKLNDTNFGTDISLYLKQYLGKTITGRNSAISATIDFIALPTEYDVDSPVIYVKYINSDKKFQFKQFEDGEELVSNVSITYGNTIIQAETPFASTISENASYIGSSASIANGVYFVRGYFVNVDAQTILLDEYSNTPSYRVGLRVDETIITAKDDDSLYDNAKGFSNYASPGADRLKINLVLTKKLISDIDDTNFIELLRVRDGVIRKLETQTQYNIIRDYLAKRTYDESGSYSVEPFDLSVHNSLNDRIGSKGLFFEGSTTEDNNQPSDDLMCIKVSPGKAYVKGYDAETTGTSTLDVEKPRETRRLENRNVPFVMGNLLRVNNVKGTPELSDTITLHSELNGSGLEIGKARVYTFNLTDSAYENASTKWDLYLYDIQTYTILTIDKALTSTEQKVSFYIEGKTSGASGYVVTAGDGTSDVVTLRNTTGQFVKGEQLIINGVDKVKRSIKTIHSYEIEDIKSVSNGGSNGNDFSADTFLDSLPIPNGIDSGTISGGNLLTSPGNTFSGIKTDTVIRYQPTSGDERFARVTGVNVNTLNLAGIGSTVSGVYEGSVVDGTYSNIRIAAPILRNVEDGYLYTELPHENIESIDTNDSQVSIRLQSNAQGSSSNAVVFNTSNFTLPTGISTVLFSAFDADNYSLHANTADTAPKSITADTFILDTTNNSVTISGVDNATNYILNATFTKPGLTSKKKIYNRSKKITITGGISAVSTSISGLTPNDYYGMRVQDKEISLNYPDVANILAVYESLNSSSPTLDQFTFESTANVHTEAIIGENIYSTNSKAVARVVSSPSNHTLEIVYLNSDRFTIGEKVTFKESNIESKLVSINTVAGTGKYKDITDSFILDKGQREQYYDYSRLVRIAGSAVPSKKILVVFDYYSVSANDQGDVFSVSSYGKERYNKDIPLLNGSIRSTDVLDFRPVVTTPFVSTTLSPFDFGARSFTLNRVITPNENCLLDYSYYLGRIDKIYIDKRSKLFVRKGTSTETPVGASENDDIMEIGTITLPPYLYDPSDAQVTMVDNKRYTMKDIGSIEDRVENLEEVTTLSLLEVNAQSIQIRDSNNNDRFKSGFFVDDFKNRNFINLNVSSIEVDREKSELIPIISSDTLSLQPAPADNIAESSLDLSTNYNLLDSNVQKTGETITLKYDSVEWIQQPLASRVENVNPFHVVEYYGTVKLEPERDTWVRTIRLGSQQVNNFSNVVRGRGGFIRFGGTTQSVSTQDVVVASGSERFMRSRNIQFSVKNNKPLTEYFHFLDGIGTLDVVPKLLEISPDNTLSNYGSSGTFIIGEDVVGTFDDEQRIIFRVAQSNHKYGAFNDPDKTFNINPYVKSENLESAYSQASKVLNVDTSSLHMQARGRYFGYVQMGMKLVGQTSGAIAYVKDVRLVSDNYGDLIGTVFIRDPYHNNSLIARDNIVKVETGTKTFRITSSSTNETPLKGSKLISFAETKYQSRGIWQQRRFVTTVNRTNNWWRYSDPLAQSFTVGGSVQVPGGFSSGDEDEDGAFVTAIDLFLAHKPSGNDQLIVEIRDMELGTPVLQRKGEPAVLVPSDINISTTGETATHVVFPEPIYLEGGREYAVVLLAPTTDQYEAWIARMGEHTVNTQSLPDAEAVRYTKQFAIGSLFKSQNGSIWTASQYEDLKFKLYKAKFTSSAGTAFFYNPTLDKGNGYKPLLPNNSIRTLPKTLKLDLDPEVSDAGDKSTLETIGTKILGASVGVGTSGYGFIAGVGGIVNGTPEVVLGGENYDGSNPGNDVDTFAITGQGSGLTLNLTSSSNVINGAAVVSGGSGYKVGDIVGIVTSDTTGDRGTGARITITSLANYDTLYLDNVQGTIGANSAFPDNQALTHGDSGTAFNSTVTVNLAGSSEGSGLESGTMLEINQFNHGMYSNTNKVVLSDVQSSYNPTKLDAPLTSTGSSITVADTSDFVRFEGELVSSNNPGLIKIGSEVIKYIEATGTIITFAGSGRAIEGVAQPHDTGDLVYKYELNGVSLKRINTEHTVSDLGLTQDRYHISINRGSGTDITDRSDDNKTIAPQVSFIDDSYGGGSEARASQNIIFGEVIPRFEVFAPSGDTVASSSIRSVTATSISGSEASFNDVGYESVELNVPNKLTTPRIVCSEVNENEYLTNLPRNKSFTAGVSLKTENTNLSPIIYLDRSVVEFRSARINDPISNYSDSNQIRSNDNDPHSAIYVSNSVNLKNPATSLKVLLSAYRHESADFRVLYQLIRSGSSEINQTFNLFPGYDNLEFADQAGFLVRDESKNSGLPDRFVRSSLENEYLEYEFSADVNEEFIGFAIKIVMNSKNQAEYPRIKDLRAIAVR
jgi:hypothetical protein